MSTLKFPTELQNQYWDEIDLRRKREIYKIKQKRSIDYNTASNK